MALVILSPMLFSYTAHKTPTDTLTTKVIINDTVAKLIVAGSALAISSATGFLLT